MRASSKSKKQVRSIKTKRMRETREGKKSGRLNEKSIYKTTYPFSLGIMLNKMIHDLNVHFTCKPINLLHGQNAMQ